MAADETHNNNARTPSATVTAPFPGRCTLYTNWPSATNDDLRYTVSSCRDPPPHPSHPKGTHHTWAYPLPACSALYFRESSELHTPLECIVLSSHLVDQPSFRILASEQYIT